jgi:putative transcriptional regulator
MGQYDKGSVRSKTEPGYLTGQLLVAMPGMTDKRFEKAVIYMCVHSMEEGAMGLIINKPLPDISFGDILQNLNIQPRSDMRSKIQVHRGGPVQTQLGFILHSADYQKSGTLLVDSEIALSTTTEILKAIAEGHGPNRNLMALGYAGWDSRQLDEEIKRNAWLNVPADADLLFSTDYEKKWDKAIAKLGIAAHMLSSTAGHA